MSTNFECIHGKRLFFTDRTPNNINCNERTKGNKKGIRKEKKREQQKKIYIYIIIMRTGLDPHRH
jgi:hypothetical protein